MSEAARKAGIKVALSGIGGDEAFGGYGTFRSFEKLLRARKVFAMRGTVGASKWAGYLPTNGSRKMGAMLFGDGRPSTLYRAFRGLFVSGEVERLVGGTYRENLRPVDREVDLGLEEGVLDAPQAYGVLDLHHYLRNMLLRDTDVMSMAHAFEVREPLLDHRLLEVAFRFDGKTKLGGPFNKWLLARAAGGLPERVTHRTKRGFSLPFDDWFRGPLAPWLRAHLLEGTASPVPRREAARVLSEYEAGRTTWSRPFALATLESFATRTLRD